MLYTHIKHLNIYSHKQFSRKTAACAEWPLYIVVSVQHYKTNKLDLTIPDNRSTYELSTT